VTRLCGARGRPRDDVREQVILDTAVALLAEVGYDRMSMDALATRAQASKATIYRRWPGKAELVVEAVRRRSSHEFATADTGSLRGDLLATLRRTACTVGADDAALVAGVVLAMRTDPELAALMRGQVVEDKRSATHALVERAVARGEVPADVDRDLVHELAPAMVFFRLLVSGEPLDEPFFLHLVDDVLLPLLTDPATTPAPPNPRKDSA